MRAVLEGVAYNCRWLLEAVEEFVGRRLDPIRIIGGGANVRPLVPDPCRRARPHRSNRSPIRFANLRGAALFAAIALGEIETDQVNSLVKVKATYSPTTATGPSTTASTPSSRHCSSPRNRCSTDSTGIDRDPRWPTLRSGHSTPRPRPRPGTCRSPVDLVSPAAVGVAQRRHQPARHRRLRRQSQVARVDPADPSPALRPGSGSREVSGEDSADGSGDRRRGGGSRVSTEKVSNAAWPASPTLRPSTASTVV